MNDLQARYFTGSGQIGEVDVRGQIPAAGRGVGIVGPRHVLLPLP